MAYERTKSSARKSSVSINFIGTIVLISIFFLAFLAYTFFHKNSAQLPDTSSSISSLNSNTYTHQGPPEAYPDPIMTPGAVFPNITSDQICVSGYSATVRDVSTATKKKVFANYSISYPPPVGDYEVDHFIALELGGSNDIANLWPEPADPKPGFHQKDVVENYLKREVCNHTITLQKAQNMIATDWYSVYLTIQK